jgi:hypothetical protein
MAVGLPLKTTYANGDVYSASDVNDTNGTINIIGNWTTWTPTTTGITLGNGSQVARYVKIGKTVHWYYSFTFGSTSAFGGFTALTLPSTPKSPFNYNARGLCRDAGTAWRFASAIQEGINVYPNVENVSGTYSTDASVGTTVPFTWTTNDYLTLSGTYEEA